MSDGTKYDTSFTEAPICPYCGHAQRDAWELDFGPGMEGDGDVWCGECDERFECSRNATISYTTRKRGADR